MPPADSLPPPIPPLVPVLGGSKILHRRPPSPPTSPFWHSHNGHSFLRFSLRIPLFRRYHPFHSFHLQRLQPTVELMEGIDGRHDYNNSILGGERFVLFSHFFLFRLAHGEGVYALRHRSIRKDVGWLSPFAFMSGRASFVHFTIVGQKRTQPCHHSLGVLLRSSSSTFSFFFTWLRLDVNLASCFTSLLFVGLYIAGGFCIFMYYWFTSEVFAISTPCTFSLATKARASNERG